MHQLSGTVEFFVGRKYGVIDVYSYDVATKTLENIVYYPVQTVGKIKKLWYSQSWGMLYALTNDELAMIVVPHG